MSPTVKLKIRLEPPVRAQVWSGRKRFGDTPLEIELPRNTGPRDLRILTKDKDFLVYNTRVYTHTDEALVIKLYDQETQETLLGFKKPLPPPDAGVGMADDIYGSETGTAPGLTADAGVEAVRIDPTALPPPPPPPPSL